MIHFRTWYKAQLIIIILQKEVSTSIQQDENNIKIHFKLNFAASESHKISWWTQFPVVQPMLVQDSFKVDLPYQLATSISISPVLSVICN